MARVPPGALVPGTQLLRPSVLFTYADVVAGVQASRRTHPRVSVTVDLNVEVLRPSPAEQVSVESRILRSGARVTVSEVVFREPDEPRAFAVSIATFMSSPREGDVQLRRPSGRLGTWRMMKPFAEHVGMVVPRPGTAELARRADLGNSTDSLQGGLTGLLCEVAAETLASAETGRSQVVRRLDVEFLAAVRVGPGVATAEVLRADRHGTTLRVEVHDTGRDDRLTALAMVECAPVDVLI
jgi:acyl-coenzyme A thioesterase PaaI-like protein